MKLSNLNVGTRIGGGFAVVLALTVLLAAVGTWQMGQMRTAFEYISINTLPSLDVLADASRGLETMRRAELRHLVERSSQGKAAQEPMFDKAWR